MERKLVYRGLVWCIRPRTTTVICKVLDADGYGDPPLWPLMHASKRITLGHTARRHWPDAMKRLRDSMVRAFLPFDGVPWEIHQIADEDAYAKALETFKHSHADATTT